MASAEIDLFDLDLFVNGGHHDLFTRLRAEDPVHLHDDPAGGSFYNLVKHPDVREANRNVEVFSSELGGTQIGNHHEDEGHMDQRGLLMIDTDPPRHSRYRRLVNKGFTPRMVGLLEDYLTHRSILIVDEVIERGECDFVDDLASELPLQAIAQIMGVPQEDRKLLFDWTNTMIGSQDPDFEGDGTEAAMALYAYTHELADKRRDDPRDDVITKLINADIEGDRLSQDEIDFFMLLLGVAGNETTRTATSNGMIALLANPEQLDLLRSDFETHIDTAVDEIIRWATPVHHFRRTSTEPTEFQGVEVPGGSRVVMWYTSANRDEDVFDNPFTFDITRTPNDHVSFGGGGAHYCLGANLARIELKLIFREIIGRIHNIKLTAEPGRLRSNFINGIKTMPITFDPGPKVNPGALPDPAAA